MSDERDKQQTITEPLPVWVERVIDRSLARHQQDCPVEERLGKLENRVSALLGYMVGSGLVGGAAGAMVAKLLCG